MGRIAGVTPAETRERLVDAAARVFERKGYEGATVAQIAREAGVTTGAIYTHYDSKAELLVDAMRAHGERAAASLFPPGTRIDAAQMLVALGARLDARPHDQTALLAEALLAARRDDEVAQVLAGALADREQLVARVLVKGQDAGTLPTDLSVDAAARFVLMVGVGSLLMRDLDLPPVDHDDWTRLIHRLVDAVSEEPTS